MLTLMKEETTQEHLVFNRFEDGTLYSLAHAGQTYRHGGNNMLRAFVNESSILSHTRDKSGLQTFLTTHCLSEADKKDAKAYIGKIFAPFTDKKGKTRPSVVVDKDGKLKIASGASLDLNLSALMTMQAAAASGHAFQNDKMKQDLGLGLKRPAKAVDAVKAVEKTLDRLDERLIKPVDGDVIDPDFLAAMRKAIEIYNTMKEE